MGIALCASAAMGWAQPLADRAPLGGTIADETGKPVASAVLTVRRQEDSGPSAFWGGEARADAQGQFSWPTAQQGRYFLSIEAPGYAPLSNMPLNWKAGSAPLRLSLSRLTSAVLRIARADGTPLVNSPVWIRARALGIDTSNTRATTDAQGEVVVPRMAPGTYSFFVASGSGSGSVLAAPIKWQEGGTRLGVPLSSGATLRIKAHDDQDHDLGGAALVLLPRSPEEAARLGGEGGDAGENWALLVAANAPQALVTRDGGGMLELKGVPAGHFTARLSLPGYGSITREVEAREGEAVEWYARFPSRRAATLTVSVRDGAGKIVPNALVALRLLPLAPDGTFAPESPFGGDLFPDPNGAPELPFFTNGPGGRVGQTDEKGNLALFPLKAGRYRVFVSRPAPEDWLRFPIAREGGPLDINVSLDGTNTAIVQVP